MTLPKSTREGRCQFHRWMPPGPSGTEDICRDCGKRRPTRRESFVTAEGNLSGSYRDTVARYGKGLKRGRGFSASPAQQKKAREEPCVVTGQEALYGAVIDPAHLWPRSRGGCDDPLCTVPLARHYHRDFDEGRFDLLPYLVKRRVPELLHALEHAEGDVVSLLERLTGERYRSGREAA